MPDWNRCDVCGKFIPYRDFASGAALRRMETPNSEYSGETWETICATCLGNSCLECADCIEHDEMPEETWWECWQFDTSLRHRFGFPQKCKPCIDSYSQKPAK